MSENPAKKFDLILYGATGYTGNLIAQYLAMNSKEGRSAYGVKWALAGRNRAKMVDIKSKLVEIEPSLVKVVAILEVDNTEEALSRIVAQTRVVIAAVGPYSLHGMPVVTACVRHGVDYVDVTGEGPFYRRVIDEYQEQAEKKGIFLVPSCGFDSIPSDLGVLFTASQIQARYATSCTSMQGYFEVHGGGASGGTLASAMGILSLPLTQIMKLQQPFYLNPKDSIPLRVRAAEKEQNFPRFDSHMKKWTTKWFMSMYNTRVVRRSVALLKQTKQHPESTYFDNDFTYNESMFVSNVIWAFVVPLGIFFFMIIALFPPTRWFLTKFVLPTPGQGQSAQKRAGSWFRVSFRGVTADQKSVVTTLQGGDGYEATAQMAAETSLCLLQDKASILSQRQGRGGVLTPATTCGLRLVDRLRAAGIKIQVQP